MKHSVPSVTREFACPKIDVRPVQASKRIQPHFIGVQKMLCYIKIVSFDFIYCLILGTPFTQTEALPH